MKKNSIVKSFIKKVVSRSPRSAFYSHVFFRLTSICLCLAVAVSAMAIPASAEIINDNLQKVTFTAEEIKLLFDSGVLRPTVTVSVASDSGSSLRLRDSSSSSLVSISRGNEVTYSLSEATVLTSSTGESRVLFFCPFIIMGPSGAASISNYSISYNFNFSFYGYLSSDLSFLTEYFDGEDSFIATQTIRVFDVNSSNTYSQTSLSSSSTLTNWGSNIFLNYIDSFYSLNASSESAFYTIFDQSLSNTPTVLTNNIVFSMAGSGSYSRAESNLAPLAFALHAFDFYEYVEPGPDPDPDPDPEPETPTTDLSEVISILRDVSSSDQEKIDNLKQAFDDVDEDLKDAADQMEVEIPDISDSVSSIPSDLMQGNEMVSQQILAPILNIQPIATIFLGVFAILAIKLLLFGSGPH